MKKEKGFKIGKLRFSFSPKEIFRSGDDGKGEVYLVRYNLLSTPWFGLKFHKIMLSDSDCMHDHPWSFITFILKGGYWETTLKQYEKSNYRFGGFQLPAEQRNQWITWRGPGSVLYRPAAMPHRLDLPVGTVDLETRKRKFQPAYTFVINFKRTRDWGFLTPMGWIYWENYTSVNKCE